MRAQQVENGNQHKYQTFVGMSVRFIMARTFFFINHFQPFFHRTFDYIMGVHDLPKPFAEFILRVFFFRLFDGFVASMTLKSVCGWKIKMLRSWSK